MQGSHQKYRNEDYEIAVESEKTQHIPSRSFRKRAEK